MVELRQVCAGYEGVEILHGINMKIEPGKITVLAGPNGCGKSTLLKTVIGLIPRNSGEILMNGRSAESYSSSELAQRIAYLPQSRNVPEISVLRMVLHGRFPYLTYPRRYSKQDVEISMEALRSVQMEAFAEKAVSSLSGGMQQKVYIAMALAQDTPVILMDEPMSFLDISHQLRLMELARELADEGKAVVLVLHDISLALRVADTLVVLAEGMISGSGSPEEVFESGILERVFGVPIKRMQTEDGWQYYY